MEMTQYANLDNEQLVMLLYKGDDKAFTQIYDRFWERLLALAVNKLDKDFVLAEDVVQDIFCDLWKRRETQHIQNLNAYLSAALKFKVIDSRNKKSRQRNVVLLEEFEETPDATTQNMLSFNELRDRLEKLVAALPEKCQLVYRLSKEADYSQKEIAKVLHISERTVESHVARAMSVLRTGLTSIFLLSAFALYFAGKLVLLH